MAKKDPRAPLDATHIDDWFERASAMTLPGSTEPVWDPRSLRGLRDCVRMAERHGDTVRVLAVTRRRIELATKHNYRFTCVDQHGFETDSTVANVSAWEWTNYAAPVSMVSDAALDTSLPPMIPTCAPSYMPRQKCKGAPRGVKKLVDQLKLL